MIPLAYYLLLSTALFCIAAYGILASRNAIRVLMCIELLFNAANINLVAFSRYLGEASGQAFVVFTISIAAAEVAVGLALFLALYRAFGIAELDVIKELRW